MEHTYTAVTKDIDLWLPKVKVGGYLSGHDYSADWHDVVRAVDEKLGKENIKNFNITPGCDNSEKEATDYYKN